MSARPLPGTLRQWALVALALHFVAAVLSAGFFHPDEQFQILEFMNMKLGRGDAARMPIEYGLALRPWLQPGILLLLDELLEALGLRDPFARATAFRMVSAVLGWGATMLLLQAALPRLKTQLERGTLIATSALLWYLPWFHARPSSENWSGAIFFIGLSLTLLADSKKRVGPFAVGGFLFGLAFGLRYHTAFLSIGAFAWWALVGRAKARELTALAGSGFAALVGLAFVDRWGYGHWTSPAVNYFTHTLVEGHVNDSDTGPLWDYVRMSFTETWPLLGTLLLAALLAACYRGRRDPFVWSAIPFLVVHHLIPHKELRFLFPLAHAGPIWLALAAPLVKPLFLRALFAYNLVALLVQTSLPASTRAALWRAISASGVTTLYYRGTDDPYIVTGLSSRFYRPADLATREAAADSVLARVSGPFALYYLKATGTPSDELLRARQCSVIARQVPPWAEPLMGRFPNVKNWQLLRCD